MSKPVLQKVIVISTINSISIGNGFIIGHMAGLVRSLKKNEDGLATTKFEIACLALSIYLFAAFGMGSVAVITEKVGRRWAFSLFSALTVISCMVLYYAEDITAIIISRVLGGVAYGALVAMKLCTTSEYVPPKSRGVYMNLVSTLSQSIGVGIGHVSGIIWHWRIAALFGIIPFIFGIFMPYFWVESPHWLASKGHFQECEEAFRKLHGNNLESEMELQLLIKVEKAKLIKAEETNSINTTRKLLVVIKRRYFWDLMVLSLFINAYLTAAAKISFNTLAAVIIEDITGSPNVLLFTLVVDFCFIIGSSMSCFLITKMSMRSMLFTTSIIAISVLLALSISVYFKSDIVVFQWVTVILLAIYFFILKAGPYPVLEALMGEIYPLEVKIYCFFITGTILMLLLSLQILLISYIVMIMGYHGLFFMNAVIMLISLGYIWWRLPETKGRSLQEIEIYFKTKTFNNIDEVLSEEQIKALI